MPQKHTYAEITRSVSCDSVRVLLQEETLPSRVQRTHINSEYTRKCNVIKLDKLLASIDATPAVSEEWGSGWTGTNFLVEIEEANGVGGGGSGRNSDYQSIIIGGGSSGSNSAEDPTGSDSGSGGSDGSSSASSTIVNATNLEHAGPKIIVRTEEVLIVGLVLMLWVGAIVLFFNRWGKIRMLEPYQPKFQQQHRSSCPLVDLDAVQAHQQRASVSRMSMGLTSSFNMPTCQFAAYNPSIYAKGYTPYTRPRQNSVFVGPSPSQFLMPKPPRKTRSAMDLHSMVLDETAEAV